MFDGFNLLFIHCVNTSWCELVQWEVELTVFALTSMCRCWRCDLQEVMSQESGEIDSHSNKSIQWMEKMGSPFLWQAILLLCFVVKQTRTFQWIVQLTAFWWLIGCISLLNMNALSMKSIPNEWKFPKMPSPLLTVKQNCTISLFSAAAEKAETLFEHCSPATHVDIHLFHMSKIDLCWKKNCS